MNLVSIVILNWNGKAFLEKFLKILIKHSKIPGVEIIIADNASTDDSLLFLEENFPDIKIISFDKNYGFTEGYNKALQQLESKYYLLLNSDIEVTEGWLEPLINFMEQNADVAACGPKILDYNRRTHFEYAGAAGGFIDKYGYTFCRGRIFDFLEEDTGAYDQGVDIFWASGACLMVRSDIFHEAGGFDPYFFAHMDEVDLCWRIKKRGHRICFVPDSCIFHVGGGTLPKSNPFKTYLNFRNNLLLLYKNLPGKGFYRIFFTRMILDGISAFRFLIRGAFKDFKAVFKAHIDFYSVRKGYRKFRQENIYPSNYVIFAEIYPRSIIVDFFLLKRRTFYQLRNRFNDLNKQSGK